MMINRKWIQICTAVLSAVLLLSVFTVPAFAAGGAYISDNYVEIAEGETAYISLGVDNAAGRYSISSSGSAAANGSGWLDNEAATVSIYGASAGSGTVTIVFDDLATYDEENLNGATLTVTVNVYTPETGAAPADKGNEEVQTPAAQEETTTADPSLESRKVVLDNEEYVVLNDLTGVTAPNGFSEADGTYSGQPVRVFKYGEDLTLYALQKTADGSVVLKIFDDKTQNFKDPKTVQQNNRVYYLLDVPEGTELPEGFSAQTVKINGQEVNGLVSSDSSYKDFYFVRAMSEGSDGYYSYDVVENSIQRCMTLEFSLNADARFAELEEAASKQAEETASRLRLFKITLLAAAVVILGLVVTLIILGVKNRKMKQELEADDRQGRNGRGWGTNEPENFEDDFLPDEFEDFPDDDFDDSITIEELENDVPEKTDTPNKNGIPKKNNIPKKDSDDAFVVTDLDKEDPDDDDYERFF